MARGISHKTRRRLNGDLERELAVYERSMTHRGRTAQAFSKKLGFVEVGKLLPGSKHARDERPSILIIVRGSAQTHQPESVDWFNVLVAQTLAQLRVDAQHDDAILTTLTALLNGPAKPSFLDEIVVTEINLGEEFPIFSNCRIIPVDGVDAADGSRPPSSSGVDAGGRLQAHMDVDLTDAITLGVETKLVLNYPTPYVAAMPVALAVSVVRFSGTLSISFIPSPSPPSPPSDPPQSTKPSTRPAFSRSTTSQSPPDTPPQTTPPTTLTFSFMPDYRLELSTHSSSARALACTTYPRSRSWSRRVCTPGGGGGGGGFNERCVEPRFQQVTLPSFWPRRKNTRGGEVGVERDETGDVAVEDTPTAAGKNGPVPTSAMPNANVQGLRERRKGTGAALHMDGARDVSGGRSSGSESGEGYRMPGALPP
ncbi:hypothetical protein MRB53_038698 [Persea americana]|nr:hypothetical protein MRB53_038698 [Persea americana]